MTFLNPLALFALAAAAIPLIIHLFNFRRPKRVEFSSLAFLKELQQTTMQRVRIKQWLLLLMRTLALACLVLAFARPTLRGGIVGALGGRAATSMAVVVDNSLSMTLRDAQGEYLGQARDLATSLIEQAEPGDEVFVLTTAGASPVLPTAYKNRGPALDAIADLSPEPGASTTGDALARAAATLDDATHLNREVYLLSDLQTSTWLDSAAIEWPEDVRLLLLPVGDRTFGNIAVTDVEVQSRIVEAGQPARVTAMLANYGSERVEGYVASLYLDGERVAQAAADLDPGATATVDFTLTPQQRGWLAGEVTIEDDAFPYDNTRYFTLHVPDQRRLLLVRGNAQRIDFVTLALSSELTRGRITFETRSIDEDAIAATNLGDYDAVVLVGPRDLSSGEVATLARYVETGGGLFLSPNAAARPADYDALLAALGGGRFSGFSGEVGSERPIAGFDRVDLEHPLFESIFEQGGLPRQTTLESPDVFYAMNYAPGTGTEHTLIQLSNGFPFLQEIRHGSGAAFLLATAPDPAWSDLPVRGLFIPLLYRSIYYLSAGESVQGDRLVIGQPAELRLTGAPGGATVRLVGPDGEESTPEQRPLFGALLLQTDGSLRSPGIYDVMAGETLVRRVAVNRDDRESDLRAQSAEEAVERLEATTGATVRLLDTGTDGSENLLAALEAERTGVELWNVFLSLALLFLIAEMLISMQWRPETAAA